MKSLLQNTVREGALSQQTRQRLADYIFSAVAAGADAVVVTCSTLGDAVDDVRNLSSVPLFRIDQGMVNEAVNIASRRCHINQMSVGRA
jgi:aspartate/glutamate racemase